MRRPASPFEFHENSWVCAFSCRFSQVFIAIENIPMPVIDMIRRLHRLGNLLFCASPPPCIPALRAVPGLFMPDAHGIAG
ncbi:hypothetical protein [Herminiimonas sp. CN]|uniref:hypothetical protein n=1 Tax=Herminiimonas sp. CN TaxID=1349818 RepID=UPI0012DC9A7C|nr:hypothetical protein [Herminiimonas sp. CN]